MASLVIPTGVASHPEISIDQLDLRNGLVGFRWIGSSYSGDCAQPFTLSLAEHGDMTVAQVVEQLTTLMVSTLPPVE